MKRIMCQTCGETPVIGRLNCLECERQLEIDLSVVAARQVLADMAVRGWERTNDISEFILYLEGSK